VSAKINVQTPFPFVPTSGKTMTRVLLGNNSAPPNTGGIEMQATLSTGIFVCVPEGEDGHKKSQ
jgi:hypothetical protein